MNTKLKVFLAFVGGAAVGSLATYYLVRESFRKQAEEEIDSVRQIWLCRETEEVEKVRKEKVGVETESREDIINQCLDTLEELGYPVTFAGEDEDDVNPSEQPEGIEEIDEAEFMRGFEDYDSTTLTLYTDGTMTDEVEDVVDDPRKYFGDIDLQSYELGDDLYFANHSAMLKIELLVSKQNYRRDILGEDDEDLYEPGDFADRKV